MTTDIRNKLGGVVFSRNGVHTTMRAQAVPSGAATAATRKAAFNYQSAALVWPTTVRSDAVFWTIAASWQTYKNGTSFGTFIAPYATFAGAYANAQLLEAPLTASGGGDFDVIQPITGYAISRASGSYVLSVYQSSSVQWQNAFLMGVIANNVQTWNKLPTSGYKMLGGSATVTPYDFEGSFFEAFGVLPEPGMVIALAIYPLYALSFLPGLIEDPPGLGNPVVDAPPLYTFITLP